MLKNPKGSARLYTRHQGGALRYYADFRDFSDVGGARESLKAPGTHRATDDPAVAEALLTARLAELKKLRRDRSMIGEGRKGATLAEVARQHLILKKESAKFTDRWIAMSQGHLERARDFFGASRPLHTIAVEDVQRWVIHLEGQKGRMAPKMSGGTIRHHLSSLSNLYKRARSLGLVPGGYNPVSDLMPGERPAGRHEEARWLEIHEASYLLDVTKRTLPRRPELACPHLYQLLATMLLTGGRKDEVLGLEAGDVSFTRKTVTFRPNAWRRLKTAKSQRPVPLWPQLEEILGPHILPLDRTPRVGLLFPTENRRGEVAKMTNFDKALDYMAVQAGWKAGEIRSRMFRNAYAAARLQTTEGGMPVSPYTVSREMGHHSLSMIERTYGHLGTVRHRSDVVEYRVEQHEAKLKERAAANSAKDVVTEQSEEYRKSLSRP